MDKVHKARALMLGAMAVMMSITLMITIYAFILNINHMPWFLAAMKVIMCIVQITVLYVFILIIIWIRELKKGR